MSLLLSPALGALLMPAEPPTGPGLARCPRCRGRVRRERDRYGSYLTCLLCGYTHELTSAAAIALDDVVDPDTAAPPGQ